MIGDNLSPGLSDLEVYDRYDIYREKYATRMRSMLHKIKSELAHFSWHSSRPFIIEEGAIAIAVSRDPTHLVANGEPDALDVEIVFRILESKEHDNTRGGITFQINLWSHEGELIRDFTPFSYCDEIWVPVQDEDRVEKRFIMVEATDPYSIVKALQTWIQGRTA